MTRTDLERTVENLQLNDRSPLQCNRCGDRVHQGESVVVRLHFDSNDSSWLKTGRFCTDCGPERTRGPEPFATEVVVRGRVGVASDTLTQDHFPVLLDPVLLDRG